jgi:hypothetical protein
MRKAAAARSLATPARGAGSLVPVPVKRPARIQLGITLHPEERDFFLALGAGNFTEGCRVAIHTLRRSSVSVLEARRQAKLDWALAEFESPGPVPVSSVPISGGSGS